MGEGHIRLQRPVEMGGGIFVVVALTPYGGWHKLRRRRSGRTGWRTRGARCRTTRGTSGSIHPLKFIKKPRFFSKIISF